MSPATDAAPALFRPGHNCWRVERAARATLLIDAEAYFSALRAAAREARHSIFIIGWDIDSRIDFPPDGDDDGLPGQLGPFLDALVRRRDTLHVYVLDWDFVLLYALDREFLPIYNLGWRTHGRLHFHLDDRHPPGASHHQKIVVIDDALAFVGGIDLTRGRWDTPRHEADEPRRKSPDGAAYGPFHDVQWMVEGAPAAALGEHARRRWERATGQALPRAETAGEPPRWPGSIDPGFEDVDVAIARTDPGYEGDPAVHEVQRLYVDSIAAAKHSIYIENQYFTSRAIGEALGKRLAEKDGPEVVLVTRRTGGGWLEKNTMELLRARLLKRLAPQDLHGRLRVYCPEQAGLDGACIDLHSKLMIVDDRILRAGSSNLNNRSMGLDTECDLALDAGTPAQRRAVAGVRNRLLAEHLGCTEEDVARALEREGTMIAAIEVLQGNARSLKPLAPELDPDLDEAMPDDDAIDPERPIDPEKLMEDIVPEEAHPAASKRLLGAVVMLLALAALALAWRYGALRDWIAPDSLVAHAQAARDAAWTPVWMLGAYVVATLVALPITLLIAATALVFGPWSTVAYALAGSVLGAGVSFAAGRVLGRRAVRRLAGARLNALSRRLGDGGVLPVVLLRMVPVAPFVLINLVAGASHLRLRDFLIGTLLGMAPGIVAIAFFADQLAITVQDPSLTQVALLALVLGATVLGILGIRALLRRHARRRSGSQA